MQTLGSIEGLEAVGHRPSLVTVSSSGGSGRGSPELAPSASAGRHHFPQGARSKVWTAAGRPLRRSSGLVATGNGGDESLRLDLALSASSATMNPGDAVGAAAADREAAKRRGDGAASRFKFIPYGHHPSSAAALVAAATGKKHSAGSKIAGEGDALSASIHTRPIPLEAPQASMQASNTSLLGGSGTAGPSGSEEEREAGYLNYGDINNKIWTGTPGAGGSEKYPQLSGGSIEEGVKGIGSRRGSLVPGPHMGASFLELVVPAPEELQLPSTRAWTPAAADRHHPYAGHAPEATEEDVMFHKKMAQILSAAAGGGGSGAAGHQHNHHPDRHAPKATPSSFGRAAHLGSGGSSGSGASTKAKSTVQRTGQLQKRPGSPLSPSGKRTVSPSKSKSTLFGVRGAPIRIPVAEGEAAVEAPTLKPKAAPPAAATGGPLSPSFFSPKSSKAAVPLPPAPHTPLGLPKAVAGLNLLGLGRAVEAEVETHLPSSFPVSGSSSSSSGAASTPKQTRSAGLTRPASSTPTSTSARSSPLLPQPTTGQPRSEGPSPVPKDSIGAIAIMAILGRKKQEGGKREDEEVAVAAPPGTPSAGSSGRGGQLFRRHSLVGHESFHHSQQQQQSGQAQQQAPLQPQTQQYQPRW
jgi:hypothetical protein